MRMDRRTTIGSYRPTGQERAPCFSIIMRSHSPYSGWITFFYCLYFSETNARLLLSSAFIVLNWNERWPVIEYSNVLSVNLTPLSWIPVTISCRPHRNLLLLHFIVYACQWPHFQSITNYRLCLPHSLYEVVIPI